MKILHHINYLLDTSAGIKQRTKIRRFIAALLEHAIADVDFNSHKGVWIATSDVLASALNIHYCIVCKEDSFWNV